MLLLKYFKVYIIFTLDHSEKYHFNTLGTSLTITSEESVKKLKCNTIESDTGNYSKIIMQVNFEW